jgi:hypothetical protein
MLIKIVTLEVKILFREFLPEKRIDSLESHGHKK